MEPEFPASSTQIGQDARGVIGQTVIGTTVIYGSVTIIQGSQALASEVTGAPAARVGATSITASAPTADEEGPNPYQGLLAFQPRDGDRFFGREAEIEDLWQRFRALHEQAVATRILVVYGPSGSSKSSLVRAGLVPELARRPPGGKAQARIALLVPGSQPLQALASMLARIATNDPAPARKTREFAEELALPNGAGEHDGLQRIAALLPEADVWPLVVVVDQLEELYSLCPDAAVRQAFLANLLRAAADRSGQVAVVVTLRSDFLGATQADSAFNRLIQAQGVFVAALPEQGLRDAIRLPAERRGRPLEPSTVDLLVEQSLGRDGALPLLQFALLRIWEGLLRGQPAAETLHQIGGVGGALAGEADRIQASLPEGDKRIARRLYLNLVQLGEGSRDTRRRVGLREVIAHGEDPAATRRVIERFASPAVRLITRSSGQDGSETLELSHEALIEAWPLLRDWLNSSRADLRFQRRLEEAARHWEATGRPEGSLWRPPDLDLLERFRAGHDADLTPLQLAFTETSRQAERGRQQRERRTQTVLRAGLVALSGLSLLALGSGAFAWHQLQRAREAQTAQFESTHRALSSSDPFTSLVYGLAAAESLLDGKHPWEAAQLSASLETAAAANELVSMPIPTGQGWVWSLLELKNGEVISGGGDGTLRRWHRGKQVGNGKPIYTGKEIVTSLIELSNGDVISGGSEGMLRRWHDGKAVDGGKPIVTSQGMIQSLAQLKNGVLISGDGSTMTLWREGMPVGDGKPKSTGQGGVESLIRLTNGELITGGADGTLRRWRDGKPLGDGKPIPTGQKRVVSISEMNTGGEVITAGSDGTLRRWRDGKPVGDGKPIPTGQGPVKKVIQLHNGDWISLGTTTLRRWRNGKPLGDGKLNGPDLGIARTLISLRNGEWISGMDNGTLQRWRDGQFRETIKPIAASQGMVLNLIELKNGELITGGSDGTLRRWRDGKPLGDGKPILIGQDGLAGLIELENGEVITGGRDGTLRRWRDGKPLGDGKPIVTGHGIVQSLVGLKNSELVTGGSDGMLRRWRNGKPVGKPIPTGQQEITHLIELKNGELISGGVDGTLRFWRNGKPVRDGKPTATGQGWITSLIVLKNGELISGGRDGTLRRWRNGRPVGDGKPIAASQGWILSLVRMRSGEIISGGQDGTLRRWQPLPVVVANICSSIDLSNGAYPLTLEPAREAARNSCRKVGVLN